MSSNHARKRMASSQQPIMSNNNGTSVPQPPFRLLNTSHCASSMSLPLSSVPVRKSSRTRLARKSSKASRTFAEEESRMPPATPNGLGLTITTRGQSASPVRSVAARYNPISSDIHRIPSRTFIRPVAPLDVLESPELNHPRVTLDVSTPAPLFTGGGTVQGDVSVTFDAARNNTRRKPQPTIFIGRIAVDILGVEMSHGKKFIFRSLANELIDETHAPPLTMVASPRKSSDAFWEAVPSSSVIPFKLNLPVVMGPPPYKSKIASIKYFLCVTLVIRIAGKQQYVRRSREISILSVHDRMSAPAAVIWAG